jgi:hypothetical protein
VRPHRVGTGFQLDCHANRCVTLAFETAELNSL